VKVAFEATAPKRPIYKRWWFWIVLVVLVAALVGVAHFTRVLNFSPNGASDIYRAVDGIGHR
jgi:hypothetical protein